MKKVLMIVVATLALSACDQVNAWNRPRNIAVVAPAPEAKQPIVLDEQPMAPLALSGAQKRPSLIVGSEAPALLPPHMGEMNAPHEHIAPPANLMGAPVVAAAPVVSPAPQIQCGDRLSFFGKPACGTESGMIFVAFEQRQPSVSGLSGDMDAKAAAIKAQAAKLGLTSFELSDFNYSVSTGGFFGRYHHDKAQSKGYVVSGRMRFNVAPVERAPAFVEWLSANKDYHVSMTVQKSAPCPAAQ